MNEQYGPARTGLEETHPAAVDVEESFSDHVTI
jgi:hypothetical protein